MSPPHRQDAIEPPHPAPRRVLKPLDLTGRDRQLRTAMNAISRVGARFARAARRTLPFLVRRRTRLLPGPVAIAEATAPSNQPGVGPSFTVTLEAGEGPAWGQLSLNSEALALVLDGALGGADDASGEGLGAELTLAQRALAGRIGRSLAEDFAKAVQEEVGLVLQITQMQAVPASERLELPGTDGLVIDCTFEKTPGSPTVSIAVSAEALQAAAKELDSEEQTHGDPRMIEAVQEVPVEVVAELGRVTLSLREVLCLTVGQVIRLVTAVDDPVRVRIGGVSKLTGVPVVSRGQLSVDIRGRVGVP